MHTVPVHDPADTIPEPASSPPPFKTCACGAIFTLVEWGALDYAGTQADDVEALELRNCSTCGSTLAVDLGAVVMGAEGAPTKSYQITSGAGVDLGVYEGATPREALDAMARDAGYESEEDSIARGIAPFAGRVVEVQS